MRRALLALAALLCLGLRSGHAQEADTDADQDLDTEQDADADPDTTVSVQVVEENWTIVLQPRCCSDCTFVSRGFKCKVKSCLSNCPWARSSATPSAVPLF